MQNFNAKIIDGIIKYLPAGTSPVHFLTKMFPMSKETAYRRIRSQTLFSIEELVAIAKYFDITTDKLLDFQSNNLFLEKDLNADGTPLDIYSNLLAYDIEIMEKLLAAKNMKITAAVNQMPFRFLPYKSLFKLDYCHCMYSLGKISLITSRYADVEVPPVINALHDQSLALFNRLDNITCVIDSTIFSNIVTMIQYYYRLKFISNEDLQVLKSELFDLLEKYEQLLSAGKNSAGSAYAFYYSFFNIESNLVFFEYDNKSLLQVWMYPKIPLTMESDYGINKWIESKVRNSMLITKTTNIQQIEIFRNVHKQVSELEIRN